MPDKVRVKKTPMTDGSGNTAMIIYEPSKLPEALRAALADIGFGTNAMEAPGRPDDNVDVVAAVCRSAPPERTVQYTEDLIHASNLEIEYVTTYI